MITCIVGCQGVVQPGGPNNGFSLVVNTKFKAGKSFQFTEKFPCIKFHSLCIVIILLESNKTVFTSFTFALQSIQKLMANFRKTDRKIFDTVYRGMCDFFS